MAYDYALVHLKFTIPLAGLLTVILKPLLTRLDVYKTSALILIAFFATLPWDAYLIYQGVWTYPPDAIAGPRLLGVPAEELFFFVVQTYITAMLYILVNKPVLHAQFLANRHGTETTARRVKMLGQLSLVIWTAVGASLVRKGGQGTYLGLILAWACPFALVTWTLSGYSLIRLPLTCVAVPIFLPTVYLWVVDELALGRGTWSIESGTKLGWCLWGSLEIEEAVFFLATNTLIVFGLVAFDRGTAVLDTFPKLFPGASKIPSPALLVRAVLTNTDRYNVTRVRGLREAVGTLQHKSRSFYLASSVFPGRFRIDLIFLYYFCRVADDLVDESRIEAEALDWINKLTGYLDIVYNSENLRSLSTDNIVTEYIKTNFPDTRRSALEQLPSRLLPQEPLYELLTGFKTDLAFTQTGHHQDESRFPIKDQSDLEAYAHRVASTVGELCLRLVFHHISARLERDKESILILAARTMGHALQYVNIARDIVSDAEMGRVYLPTDWLKEEGLTPQDIIRNPEQPKAERLRQKLLDLAFKEYSRSRPIMNMLPHEIRGPLVVAVENYMEIGRVLRERGGAPSTRPRRWQATVPRLRRMWVTWKNLSSQ